MDYKEAEHALNGQEWWNVRWDSYHNFCLFRRDSSQIDIQWRGWQEPHAKTIATIHKDGKFTVKKAFLEYRPRVELNKLLPYGHQLINYRGHMFLGKDGKAKLLSHTPKEPGGWRKLYDVDEYITIHKDGRITGLENTTLNDIRNTKQREDYIRNKPRRRGQYWINKTRTLAFDRTKCKHKKQYPCPMQHRWQRRLIVAPQVFDCGCKAYTKPPPKCRGLTVKNILDEKNATVRTAKIKIYGINKFMEDAGAKEIQKYKEYSLLDLNTGFADIPMRNRWETEDARPITIRAIKMTCPSTGEIYVNTIPSEINTISTGLDWIYNTPHYLERLEKET